MFLPTSHEVLVWHIYDLCAEFIGHHQHVSSVNYSRVILTSITAKFRIRSKIVVSRIFWMPVY